MKCVYRRPQEGVGAPGAGDTGDCEKVFMVFLQQVHLITEPSLKPLSYTSTQTKISPSSIIINYSLDFINNFCQLDSPEITLLLNAYNRNMSLKRFKLYPKRIIFVPSIYGIYIAFVYEHIMTDS